MSYESITISTNDQTLRSRIQACVNQEVHGNPTEASSVFGAYALDQPWIAYQALIWPVCISSEAAYASALAGGNPNPGGDPAVITDGAILSAVQANWPTEVPAFLPPVTPI